MRRFPAAALASLVLAFVVAAAVYRAPPDFAALPVMATVRDDAQRPLWSIRLAARAHEIAVDDIGAAPSLPDRVYQLWLAAPDGPQSLGLLPANGRKVIPEIPAVAARLSGAGELLVSRGKARGSPSERPAGPIVYRAAFGRAD